MRKITKQQNIGIYIVRIMKKHGMLCSLLNMGYG